MSNSDSHTRRIALITVHGVGDQAQGDTAKAAAKLLLTFPGDASFVGFDSSEVDLPVKRVVVVPTSKDPSSWWRLFDERPPSLRRLHAMPRQQAKEKVKEWRPELEFMHDQLSKAEIQDDDMTYQTIRLTGRRMATPDKAGTPPRVATEVHVFEMYWADLSRLIAGVFRFFSEFYLLLFFVCQLGRKNLDFAQAKHSGEFWWQAFRVCEVWAERIFVRFLSVLNIYLLAAAVVLIPINIPGKFHPIIVGSVVGLLVLAGAFWIFNSFFPARCFAWGSIPSCIVAGSASALVLLLFRSSFTFIAVFMSWLVAVAGVWWLMYAFNKRQPGVFVVTIIAGLAITGLFVGFAASNGLTTDHLIEATLWTVEYVWAGLAVLWLIFGVLSFLTGLTGTITVVFAKPEDRGRTWRTVWTVAISLALSPMLFLVLTLALWSALAEMFSNWLPENCHTWTWMFARYFSRQTDSVPQVVNKLINESAPPVFYLGFLFLLVCMALAAWFLLPAVLSERTRPEQINIKKSQWLGTCLNAGLRALVTTCACFSLVVLLGSLLVPFSEYVIPIFKSDSDYRQSILLVLAGAIVAVVSARGQLKALTLGLRSVLDIILDVANWLRYLPAERNPRNRICARYVSLLRYICAWRDPQDQRGYDGIVIMAHSQGCVITMDLLRFLKDTSDPALSPLVTGDRRQQGDLSIRLFTMGNPLHQMYSWPLPDLYGWARIPSEAMAPLPTDIPSDQAPAPGDLLGVVHWINAYRSGDYIGRHIWRTKDCTYLYNLADHVSCDAANTRKEFCIGNGGHTHYWDSTAPDIARVLGDLILES